MTCTPSVCPRRRLGTKTLVPQLIGALEENNARHILVICGGVIPSQDYAELKEVGVAAIYGPGTNIPEAAREVIELISERNT